ncbi:MAG: hypothetical protein IPP71_02380 [Bacteroidetes bacterium]|nr:hypothetical protein [Bacteroidota bacterium]
MESHIDSTSSILQNANSTFGKEVADSISPIVQTKSQAKVIYQTRVLRTQEGVSDANLNGKAILIQLDVSKNIYIKYPDTIIGFLNQYYTSQSPTFPDP